MKQTLKTVYEVFRTTTVVLVLAFFIRTFIIQPFVVEGRSMEPAFHDNDYLIVNKLEYAVGDPARGDVVVFEAPTHRDINFIKRIVGLPGEVVRIEGDKIFINGNELPEVYANNQPDLSEAQPPMVANQEYFLGQNEYFVLGDNRDHSSDSREWGALHRAAIVGRAWITVFPTRALSFVNTPDY